MERYKIQYLPVGQLILNPDNPRLIRDANFKRLVKSLKDCPSLFDARPCICSDRTGKNVIMGGNMRYLAAKELKYKEVPAIIMTGLTPDQEQEIAIKDNGETFGEWNMDALSSAWDDLPLIDWGVKLPEDWSTPPAAEGTTDAEPQVDRAEELNKTWGVKTGDLWQIGNHRLLCGDSTKKEDVGRVMGGERAVCVFTDPPYGVSIVSADKATGSIGFGGKLGFVGACGMVPVNAYHPIIGDDTIETAENFYKACIDAGINDFVLWGGNYFTTFLPASPCWLIWDKREDIPSNNFADCEIAWTSFDKPSRIYRHLWSGLLRKGNRKDELICRVHPTQKPVGLAVNIMQDFPADIYFDGFLGSGSFMVAAQNVGKRMYGIEMDASYCATILQRMTDAFPGIEIRRIEP